MTNNFKMNLIIFSIFLLNNILLISAINAPSTSIPQGLISGTYKESYEGKIYQAYEGIPYAKPPVGKLRFEAPQPAGNWDGILTADQNHACLCYIPIPYVRGPFGSEDCLYMYVYVPGKAVNTSSNFDVIVHIHGGAYMIGSPKFMSDPTYIMDKNVITVMFNYRLAILGFLSTEDAVVPGNNGLKDQTLALKWIQDNIKYFGGNPDSVTITGSSAGGASVHYHYLSPMSRGLFARGYSQSGTALQPWALTENPLSNAKQVAASLNCPTMRTAKMIACLKKVTGDELVKAMRVLWVFLDAVPFTPFGPVIEPEGPGAFLTEHPFKLLKQGRVYDVPWIASNVKEEGLYPAGFISLLDMFGELNRNWENILVYSLDINNTVTPARWHEVVQKVANYYLKGKPVTANNIYDLVQMFTDRTYLIGSELAIRTHAKAVKSPVYYYFFTYLIEQPFLFDGVRPGVSHSDDGRLIFKILISPNVLKPNDELMMHNFIDFLADYAATGKVSFHNVDWKPLKPRKKKLDYLLIESPTKVSMASIDEMAPTEFYRSLKIQENDMLF